MKRTPSFWMFLWVWPLLGTLNSLSAQQLDWALDFNNHQLFPGNLLVDAVGNSYLSGNFEGSFDFDAGPGIDTVSLPTGQSAFYIVKYDALGQYQWRKLFPSTGRIESEHMQFDAAGNLILLIGLLGDADLDPGPDSAMFYRTYPPQLPPTHPHYLGNTPEVEGILKLDPDGNFLWAKLFDLYTRASYRSLGVDRQGNLLLGGTVQAPTDFDFGPDSTLLGPETGSQMFFQKLAPNGDLLWVKIGTGIYPTAIRVDSMDHIWVAGLYGDKLILPGNDTINDLGACQFSKCQSIYIWKMDALGNTQWVKTMQGSRITHAFLEIDRQGNVIVGGTAMDGGVDFDPGPGVVMFPQNQVVDQSFFVKLDANGNFQWLRHFQGDDNEMRDMEVDACGNVYATGVFTDTVDFDPGAGLWELYNEYPLPYASERKSAYVSRLDKDGKLDWAYKIGDRRTTGTEIKLDADSSVWVMGSFRGTGVDFDPGPGQLLFDGPPLAPGTLYYDFFLQKVSQPGCAALWATDIEESPLSPTFTLSPNPATEWIQVSFPFAAQGGAAEVAIVDLQGRQLSVHKHLDRPISVSDLAPGLYLLVVQSGNKRYAQRFVKQ